MEIIETVVEETAKATGVRLVVSDVPKDAIGASFRLDLLATLPAYKTPLLAQLQRQALLSAIDVLRGLENQLLQTFPPHVRPEPDRR